MTEGINGIGFNPASINNSNTSGSKAEHKEEEQEQAAPQAPVEEKSVAPNDVLNFLSQTAAINMLSFNSKTVQTPVGIAAGEMFDELAPLVAQGVRENMSAAAIEMAEEFAQQHPEVVQRMEGAMEVFEEEFGAVPAFFNVE